MSDSSSFPDHSPVPEPDMIIPKLLWSFETGEPFHRCLMCHVDLIKNSALYFINKCFQDEETIFEIAICFQCHQKLRSELSESSLNRIQNYLEEFSVDEWILQQKPAPSFHDQIQNCLIKKRPPKPKEETQIIAYCMGSSLIRNIPAMMLTWEAVQDIEKLLSKSTRDVMDNFTETYLGPTSGSRRPKWVPV